MPLLPALADRLSTLGGAAKRLTMTTIPIVKPNQRASRPKNSAVQQANQDLTNAVPALAGGLACDYGDLPTFMQELYLNKISVAQVTANMQAAWERSCKAKGQPGF
jgi:hypothetical protein